MRNEGKETGLRVSNCRINSGLPHLARFISKFPLLVCMTSMVARTTLWFYACVSIPKHAFCAGASRHTLYVTLCQGSVFADSRTGRGSLAIHHICGTGFCCVKKQKNMNKRRFCSLFTFIACSSKNHFFCNKKKRTESLIVAGLVFV